MPAPTAAPSSPINSLITAAALTALIGISLLSSCSSVEARREASIEALQLPPMSPEVVYETQCARCHEPALIGARPSRIYNAPNLNAAYLNTIGRDQAAAVTLVGGQLLGKSRWMPAYEEKLGPQRVGELIDYLMTR